MAFVGLQVYTASVCLFHRNFGKFGFYLSYCIIGNSLHAELVFNSRASLCPLTLFCQCHLSGGSPSSAATAFFNVGPQHRRSQNSYSKYAPLEGQPKRPQGSSWSDSSQHENGASKVAKQLEEYFPLRYDENVLNDYVDSLDEIVFKAILERFENDVQKALL